MEIPSITVRLDPEMDKSLRQYIYDLTKESIDRAKYVRKKHTEIKKIMKYLDKNSSSKQL